MTNSIMKKIILFFIMAITCIPAFAFRIEYGRNVIISQPVYENLYIAGGNITINAPVYGDLIIAGGTIIINDTVTKDILLAGGTVIFNGFVGDDVRCIGGNIHIVKNVTGEVVVSGGRITIDKGVTIGGLIAGGGNITIDGDVKGELRGTFGNLVLNGSVSGNLNARGGSITVNGTINGKSLLSARHIILGPRAVFNNDVRYWTKQHDLDFTPNMKNGKAEFDPILRIRSSKWYYLGSTSLKTLAWYLGMALLMILIIQYLFSSTMRKAANTVFNHSLKSLGMGLLFLLVIPVTALVAFVTVVGVPVGLLLLFGYISLLLLATVISSVVAANWINNRNNKKWNNWRLGFVAFGVFILFKFISLTPVAGVVIMILLVCISFGSILVNVQWKRRQAVDSKAI